MNVVVQPSQFVERNTVLFAADMDDPEINFLTDDDSNGTIVYCHPEQEAMVRDVISRIGEYEDTGEWATAVRRGNVMLVDADQTRGETSK